MKSSSTKWPRTARATIGIVLSASIALLGSLFAQPTRAQPVSVQNTFTMATRLTDSTFDPALHLFEFDAMNIVNIYEPLVYPVPGSPPQGHLATSWRVSENGTLWTFSLRRNVIFHDGRTLTAQDVVYSMDRMLTIGRGYSYLWAGILAPGATKMVDDYTVQFKLKKPFGPFLETLVQFFVVNSRLLKENTRSEGRYGENGDYGLTYLQDRDAGSGPYRVESVTPDSRRVLTRFDRYWRGWSPGQFDRVVIEIIRETATAKALLLSGRVDMVDQWHPVEFYKELKRESGAVVPEDVDTKLYLIQMNNRRPPFDDVKFRRAVSYAFDYNTALNTIFGGAERAHGAIPKTLPGYDSSTFAYEYNPAKAKALLAESKYRPDQHVLRMEFLKAGVHEEIGLLLQSNLAALGIKMEIRAEQWPTLVQNASRVATTAHFFPVYNTAKYPSADDFTFSMFHPGNAGSWKSASWYSNQEVNLMMFNARLITDPEKRNAMYAQAAKRLAEDAAALFVAYPIHRVGLRSNVEGYRYNGIMSFDLRVYDLKRRP